MNPETERKLAAMIMEEANMMRQRAEADGVSAYLAKPVVKARPNRQFLTSMVRSVQHANRLVDMEEMWRQRELEHKAKRDKSSHRSRNEDREERSADRDYCEERQNSDGEASESLSDQDDDGLKDEDIEKFLQSRVKRGRGAVGSRMDEPGPYCARVSGPATDTRQKEDWEERIACPVAGPSIMPQRNAAVDMNTRRDSKKHKKGQSGKVDGSDSDEPKSRKRSRESKERRRKKDKKKSKEAEKHSKKKRKDY